MNKILLVTLLLLNFSCKKEEPKYKYKIIEEEYFEDDCGGKSGGGNEYTSYLTLSEAALHNYDFISKEHIDTYCPGDYDVHHTSVAILQGKYY
jgi:hypothetical protein